MKRQERHPSSERSEKNDHDNVFGRGGLEHAVISEEMNK